MSMVDCFNTLITTLIINSICKEFQKLKSKVQLGAMVFSTALFASLGACE